MEGVLAVVGEGVIGKCVCVPIDFTNFLDVEFDYNKK
jgi:hypothetical protein